jgi:hypothetical protein
MAYFHSNTILMINLNSVAIICYALEILLYIKYFPVIYLNA